MHASSSVAPPLHTGVPFHADETPAYTQLFVTHLPALRPTLRKAHVNASTHMVRRAGSKCVPVIIHVIAGWLIYMHVSRALSALAVSSSSHGAPLSDVSPRPQLIFIACFCPCASSC